MEILLRNHRRKHRSENGSFGPAQSEEDRGSSSQVKCRYYFCFKQKKCQSNAGFIRINN